MNLPSPQEAQDVLRSKSLDEREAVIRERELLLNDSERIKQLDLLDKRIAAKEEQIGDFDGKISSLNVDYNKLQKRYDNSVVANETLVDKYANKTNKLVQKLKSIEEQIENSRDKLTNIEVEITSRKSYLEEQEKIVNSTIADWNVRLGDFQHECMLADEKKNALNIEIIRLEQLIQGKSDDTKLIEQKTESLQVVYDRKVNKMKDDLSILESEISEKSNILLGMSSQYKKRTEDIETKERSLRVYEQSLNQKERELEVREQQLEVKIRLTKGAL